LAKGKVLQAVVDVAGNIDPSLGKVVEDVVEKLEGINLKAIAVGAAVGTIAIVTATAVMDAGAYLLDLGGQFDSVTDSIRIGTGATGDALDDLLEDFDAVYSSIPTTMEDGAQAIADYNTRLGLTGPELQEISKQAIQVSDMLGDDLGSVIEESSQAFQQWNIDAVGMSDAMDYVFKASQSTGTGFTDLLSKVQQFGPQLQDMGYSFEEATALIGQLDKAGVNADEVLGAMKKSVGTLAKEGIGAADGLAMYVEQIEQAETAAEAAAIASEVFGARAGSTMADAIRDGSLAVGDLTAELMANQETIASAADDTYDFAERLQVMRQGLEVALKPMANTIFDGINGFMPTLTSLMEKIVPIIGDAVEAATPFVEEFLMGAAAALEDLAPLLADLAASLLPILTKLISSLLPPILKLAQALLPPLMKIVEAILPPVAELLTSILPMLSEIGAAILPVLAEVLAALLPVITPVLDVALALLNQAIIPILPLFGQLIEAILPAIMQLINSLIPVLTPLLDVAMQLLTDVVLPLLPPIMQLVEALLPLFAPLISAFLPLLTPLLGALGPIADVLATIVGWISKVVGWVADGLGWVVDLFTGNATVEMGDTAAAAYAAGGFTSGLSIAGEDPYYPVEAVISFNPTYRSQNLAYWAEAGRMLGAADYDSGDIINTGNSTTVVYDLGGVSFAPQVTVQGGGGGGKQIVNDIIQAIKQCEPEFFDYLEEFLRHRKAGTYAEGEGLF